MKKWARLVPVLAVAAALLSTTGCNWLMARDQLNKGIRAFKAGDYPGSIKNFQEALRRDKNLKVAKLYLATAYMQQYVPEMQTPENENNAQQAIQNYKEVLSQNPDLQIRVTALKSLASLYMSMKKFDDSADYYRKAIDADPNDPEAYYSVGVIDWSAVYKDVTERKAAVGLKIEEPLKSREICEQIKSVDGPKIEDGMNMLQKAMEKRADYDDAMTYVNLLYHRKADTECGDPQGYANDIKAANDWSDKAMAARKKKFEEANKKVQGGITLDQPKK